MPNYQGAIKSVITPQGHYIFHEKLVEELYEWEKDPAEDNDLAKTSDGRRITEELADRLPGELREARKEK